VSHELEGSHFFGKRNGRLHATPLLVGLVFLEATDIIFAVDSVPAVFAFTNEPLIVFTSNIFAILGLRALYFLLAGAVERFYLLRYGLGTVLVFVGLKMVWLNQLFDGKFPILISLGIIATVLAASVILSLVFPRSASPEKGSQDKPPALVRQPEPTRRLATVQRRRTRKRPLSTTGVLWKAVGLYALLLGLALILAAAIED
jgi:predicted tellurium resistance membrane protein TerC